MSRTKGDRIARHRDTYGRALRELERLLDDVSEDSDADLARSIHTQAGIMRLSASEIRSLEKETQ